MAKKKGLTAEEKEKIRKEGEINRVKNIQKRDMTRGGIKKPEDYMD